MAVQIKMTDENKVLNVYKHVNEDNFIAEIDCTLDMACVLAQMQFPVFNQKMVEMKKPDRVQLIVSIGTSIENWAAIEHDLKCFGTERYNYPLYYILNYILTELHYQLHQLKLREDKEDRERKENAKKHNS